MGRVSSAAVLALYVVALATALVCPCVSEAAPSSAHGCCENASLRAAPLSCCSGRASEPRPASVEPAGFVPELAPVVGTVPPPVAVPRPGQIVAPRPGVASPPTILRI